MQVLKPGLCKRCKRAADGSRTRDLVLTKDALYRLSYSSGSNFGFSILDFGLKAALHSKNPKSKIQNPKLPPARRSTFPTPFLPASRCSSLFLLKAGEGNRTLVFSLEGYCSTIELHPQLGGTGFEPVKAVPSDLQSDPFDRSGNPPLKSAKGIESRVTLRGFPKAQSPLRRPIHRNELAEGLEPTTC